MSLTVAPAPQFEALPGIRYGFFGSRGGVSTGIYASLNGGQGSGDDPGAVAENRRRVADALTVEETSLVSVFQCHSDRVATVTEPWTRETRPRCDAMVTARPGIALGVLAADCGPVLLADAEAGVVGAAHAGWKGALAGVLPNTVAAMERLGADRSRTVAALGPCIRQPSYEVGSEFPAPFLGQDEANARYFCAGARAGHFQFDLGGYIVAKLEAAGLAAVYDTGLDTYADPDRLFSFRRNTHRGHRDYGRNVSAICLTGEAG
ncbi:MAG: peptidoglycan editing factor PgeF [Rhodospirillaceae bacterium]|nr:peptidoglycan editing factor PgeF [Rhodospirillaceae bacterium]